MAEFIGAVDQGTTNTRFMIFDHGGNEVARHQLEHEQIMPQPGWVEHDPTEIWERTRAVIETGLRRASLQAADLAAVGIANQRETTLVWNRRTGQPYYNAIVWQDTRTDWIAAALERDGRGDIIRKMTGLPPAACFSGGKIQWILENIDGVRGAAERGDALFGTVDSWLLWQLTGGADGGVHITDPTNASRTMLMDLATLDWDDQLLSFFDIPRPMLPEIRPSADPRSYAVTRPDGPFGGEVRLAGDLGDQQAAIVGQACFGVGEAKSTYGTGSFLLLNVGTEPIRSDHGLLSTVCYQFGDAAPAYALEGSIAVTGSAVQWLRDQLGVISSAAQSEELADEVDDTAGMYFVPAFSGLFAPHWRPDARGAIVGLSRYNTNAHLARATLEAICYQTRDVVEAMRQDCGVALGALRVDGGVTANELCMQIQADILGVPVSRPFVAETTALGAGYAAGLAVEFWGSVDELRQNWQEDRRWLPQWDDRRRAHGYAGWKKAVNHALGWVDVN
jgi:glycerol kinase